MVSFNKPFKDIEFTGPVLKYESVAKRLTMVVKKQRNRFENAKAIGILKFCQKGFLMMLQYLVKKHYIFLLLEVPSLLSHLFQMTKSLQESYVKYIIKSRSMILRRRCRNIFKKPSKKHFHLDIPYEDLSLYWVPKQVPWIQNILEGKEEKSRVIYTDSDPSTGFTLILGVNIQNEGNETLSCIAIPRKQICVLRFLILSIFLS